MMKKRLIRHNFNMVEIMLAVIVIALGLTSTFVLFPVGLNATRDAVAENHISDASEAIITNIHTHILPKLFNTTTGEGYAFKSNLTEYFYDPSTASDEIKKYIEDGIDNPGGTEIGNGLFELGKGVYLLSNVTPASTDQQPVLATIKLDRDSNSGFENEYFYTRSNTFQQYSELNAAEKCIDKFLLPIVIEVSWPANMPSSEREKRIFRYEMFNLEYELKTLPGA